MWACLKRNELILCEVPCSKGKHMEDFLLRLPDWGTNSRGCGIYLLRLLVFQTQQYVLSNEPTWAAAPLQRTLLFCNNPTSGDGLWAAGQQCVCALVVTVPVSITSYLQDQVKPAIRASFPPCFLPASLHIHLLIPNLRQTVSPTGTLWVHSKKLI